LNPAPLIKTTERGIAMSDDAALLIL